MFSDRIYQIAEAEKSRRERYTHPGWTGNKKLNPSKFPASVVQGNAWTARFRMSFKVAAALAALASHYPEVVILVTRLHRNFAFRVATPTISVGQPGEVRRMKPTKPPIIHTNSCMPHAFCSPARFFCGYSPAATRFDPGPRQLQAASLPKMADVVRDVRRNFLPLVVYIRLLIKSGSVDAAMALLDKALQLLMDEENPKETLDAVVSDDSPLGYFWPTLTKSTPTESIETRGNLRTNTILRDCFAAALDARSGHHSCALIERLIERSNAAPHEYALFDTSDPEVEQEIELVAPAWGGAAEILPGERDGFVSRQVRKKFVECLLTKVLPLKCLKCFTNILEAFGTKYLELQKFENIEEYFHSGDGSCKDPSTGGSLMQGEADETGSRLIVLSPERVCYVALTQCDHWIQPVKYMLDYVERQAKLRNNNKNLQQKGKGKLGLPPQQLHAMECLRTLARTSLNYAFKDRAQPRWDFHALNGKQNMYCVGNSSLSHSPLLTLLWDRSGNGATVVNSAINEGFSFSSGNQVALSEFMGRPLVKRTVEDTENEDLQRRDGNWEEWNNEPLDIKPISRNVHWIPNIHHLVVGLGEVSPTTFHHGHLRRLCEHIALATSRVAPPGSGSPIGHSTEEYKLHLKYYCPPVSQCLSLLKLMLAQGCVTKEKIEANAKFFSEQDKDEMRTSLENKETLLHVLAQDPTWETHRDDGLGHPEPVPPRIWYQDAPASTQDELLLIDPATWGYGPRHVKVSSGTGEGRTMTLVESSALYHRKMPKEFYEHIELIKQAVELIVDHGVAKGVTRKELLSAQDPVLRTPLEVAKACYHHPSIVEAFELRRKKQTSPRNRKPQKPSRRRVPITMLSAQRHSEGND